MQEIYLVKPELFIDSDEEPLGFRYCDGEQTAFISYEDAVIEANRIKTIYLDLLDHSPIEKLELFNEIDRGERTYPFFNTGVVMDLLESGGEVDVEITPTKIYPIGTVL